MIQSGDLLSDTPMHTLFESPIASIEPEDWLTTLPATAVAVSIACGSPSPVETRDISALVQRPLQYIGYDNDPVVIERARQTTAYFEKNSPFPLSALFDLRDLSKPLPGDEQQIADIVLFNTPDVLGTQQNDYAGSPHETWRSITQHGLDILKPGGMVIVTTISSQEYDIMKQYLIELRVNIIINTINPLDFEHFGHYGVLLGIKS